MKKLLAGMVLNLLLPAFCSAQISDREKAGLKGRVASVKIMPEDFDKSG